MNSSLHKRPTVLVLISSEGYFGAENMLVALAVSLDQLECTPIVGVFTDARSPHVEVEEQARTRGLRTELIPCAGRVDWRTVRYIRRLMRDHGADVLHTHGYKADLYALVASRRTHTALVTTAHNWPSREWMMRAYAALDRRAMRSFDRVVTVSDEVGEIVRRSGVAAKKVVTISNGVEPGRFELGKPTLRAELACNDQAVVGFVGRFVADKGGDILLRAAQQVLQVHRKTRFVLVGDGPCRQPWESLATELGIAEQVSFAGVRQDMPDVYASFDVFVLPSLCEAMPMCVLEAMAAKKPVIATRVGAIAKLVEPERTGTLVETGNVGELAAAVIRTLGDPEAARRQGEHGHARVIRDFSSESMAREYLSVYRDVLQLRGNARAGLPAWGIN